MEEDDRQACRRIGTEGETETETETGTGTGTDDIQKERVRRSDRTRTSSRRYDATEERKMRKERGCLTRCGRHRRVVCIAPRTFVEMTASNSAPEGED